MKFRHTDTQTDRQTDRRRHHRPTPLHHWRIQDNQNTRGSQHKPHNTSHLGRGVSVTIAQPSITSRTPVAGIEGKRGGMSCQPAREATGNADLRILALQAKNEGTRSETQPRTHTRTRTHTHTHTRTHANTQSADTKNDHR